ncbi:MAG TPA: SCO family protein [Rhodanobacter sp.]|nr:SCO family protein [Rhodanobacter sp.]
MKPYQFIRGTAVMLAFGVWPLVHAGQPTTLRAPAQLLEKVGFTQQLGAQVPLDAEFHDDDGRMVQLRDLLNDKPTLLVPGYFSCTNLCSVVRVGVANAIAGSGLQPGKQFNVVLVSIDPADTPKTAAMARRQDAGAHANAFVQRWHYLTSNRDASAALMRSIGFRYFHDTRNGQYDHDAGIVLLSPQGKVTQYLFGVKFVPETLRLALVNASQGRIGSIVDHFLLLCCNYDASTGRYSLVIHRVMQALGIATVVTLLLLIVLLRRSEQHRRRAEES